MNKETGGLFAPETELASNAPPNAKRFFDSILKKHVVSITQGEFYVSANPGELISTVLGSCIAVCMYDPNKKLGGMNHFLLPNATRASPGLPSVELRYGSFSIERLLNALIARGSKRTSIEVKVFGGANILHESTNIGHRNADFVESYLKREELIVSASQLRGTLPRRVRLFPTTGQVQLAELGRETTGSIRSFEKKMLRNHEGIKAGSAVDLFEKS